MSTDADTKAKENAIDVSLMLRVRDGDMRAFEELVDRHQNAVVGTVAKMLKGHAVHYTPACYLW